MAQIKGLQVSKVVFRKNSKISHQNGISFVYFFKIVSTKCINLSKRKYETLELKFEILSPNLIPVRKCTISKNFIQHLITRFLNLLLC